MLSLTNATAGAELAVLVVGAMSAHRPPRSAPDFSFTAWECEESGAVPVIVRPAYLRLGSRSSRRRYAGAPRFLVLGLAQLGVAVALRRSRELGARRLRFLDLAVVGAAVAQLAPLAVGAIRDVLGYRPCQPW
jgi:Ca2+-transporting ATPase